MFKVTSWENCFAKKDLNQYKPSNPLNISTISLQYPEPRPAVIFLQVQTPPTPNARLHNGSAENRSHLSFLVLPFVTVPWLPPTGSKHVRTSQPPYWNNRPALYSIAEHKWARWGTLRKNPFCPSSSLHTKAIPGCERSCAGEMFYNANSGTLSWVLISAQRGGDRARWEARQESTNWLRLWLQGKVQREIKEGLDCLGTRYAIVYYVLHARWNLKQFVVRARKFWRNVWRELYKPTGTWKTTRFDELALG